MPDIFNRFVTLDAIQMVLPVRAADRIQPPALAPPPLRPDLVVAALFLLAHALEALNIVEQRLQRDAVREHRTPLQQPTHFLFRQSRKSHQPQHPLCTVFPCAEVQVQPRHDRLQYHLLVRRPQLLTLDDLRQAVRVEVQQVRVLVQLLKVLERHDPRLSPQLLAHHLLGERPVVEAVLPTDATEEEVAAQRHQVQHLAEVRSQQYELRARICQRYLPRVQECENTLEALSCDFFQFNLLCPALCEGAGEHGPEVRAACCENHTVG
mmetsp:Transcript_9636/g.22859  ORF Transcript_9636/g.22859 Transcript_9636/m.22859 type:complete len:266 (-) Transcript_9636:315-1112(-)